MKTRLPRFIGLTALAALLSCVSPAAAYWPPCQDVTGPTVDPDTMQVTASVYNPATGQNVPGSWDNSPEFFVDLLRQNQGIIAWRDLGYGWFRVHFATYDPVRGWMHGSSPGFYNETSIRSVQDGMVWYEENYTEGATIHSNQHFATYDPAVGAWTSFTWEFSGPTAPPGLGIKGYYSKNGVVAVHHNLTSNGSDKLYFMVYDPFRRQWKYDSVGGAAGDVIVNVQINAINGAIGYKLNGSPILTKGYSVDSGAWQNGWPDLYAGFVAQPVSGNAPLSVWVTDMSLGAVAGGSGVTFNYDWGDGTPASTNRSDFHNYTGYNQYTLGHTVARGLPSGSDTRTVQIITKPRASLPFADLLLLGD